MSCLDPLENSTTPRPGDTVVQVYNGLDPLENSTTPRRLMLTVQI